MSKKMKQKVLVAMSGGVDSSVVAALLVKQGYEVTGAYMKQWSDTKDVSGLCAWKQDRRDAMRVAAHLGIPLMTLDFETEYKEWVMGYMFEEYKKGRTPNPDVMCNKFIKFDAWLKKVQELGFEKMATGHYASISQVTNHESRNNPGEEDLLHDACYMLHVPKDKEKDQTYFLHQLSEEQLSHTLFPLGEYTKAEVRKMAEEFGLPTAHRAESMGICFVGEIPMKDFLSQKIEKTPGNIVTEEGSVIGTHDGLPFYTIGQRHLGQLKINNKQITNQDAFYVVEKRFDTNELVVGSEESALLFKKEILVDDMHWISGQPPDFPLHCKVRLRHRQALQHVVVTKEGTTYTLLFESEQRAVTPGQFAVLYKDGVCLGGGAVL